jgi:hypothetical protein
MVVNNCGLHYLQEEPERTRLILMEGISITESESITKPITISISISKIFRSSFSK